MPGILVGLDGSHYSERALEWAAKEAAIRHAPLRVLAVHTVPVGWSGRGTPYPEDNEIVVRTKASAQELTDKVLAGMAPRAPTGSRLRRSTAFRPTSCSAPPRTPT